MNAKLNALAGKGYNYIDQVSHYGKRDQFQQQYNISVGNTTERNSVYASVTYKRNKFEDINSNNESLGLNLKNTLTLSKWIKLDFGTYVNFSSARSQSNGLMSPGYTVMPYDDLVNPDGSYYTSSLLTLSWNQKIINDYTLKRIYPLDRLAGISENTDSQSFYARKFRY